MKRIVLFVLVLKFVLVYGQKPITGHVRNAFGEGVAYASVMALTPSDSTYVNGAVCNSDGEFSLATTLDHVLLKVSSIGYKDCYIACSASADMKIELEEEIFSQREVVVKGKRHQHKLTEDALVTTVNGTLLEKLGTLDDVLAKIPGVVKLADGYEVFGKGTPVYYVNGRKLYDVSELSRIKAEDVKDISVINNPGSKYDASVKAVILIRTKTPKGEGLGGTLQSLYKQAQYADFVEMAHFVYRRGRLDVFNTAYFAKQNAMQYSEISQTLSGASLLDQELVLKARSSGKAIVDVMGLNYALSETSSVGMRYSIQYNRDNKGVTNIQGGVMSDHVYQGSLYSSSKEHKDMRPKHEWNGYYKGLIGKVSTELDVDYLHDSSDTYADVDESSEELESRYVTSHNYVRNNMVASKLILGWNMGKFHLNIGEENSFTNRNDYYINPEEYVPTSFSKLKESQMAPFLEISTKYKYGT